MTDKCHCQSGWACPECRDALQAENERLREERATLAHEVLVLAPEIERLREALRENVGEAYNLITQGESPTQRRQPSAQRIYDRSKEALAQSKEDGRA